MSLKTQSGQPCMLLLKLGQKEHLEKLRAGLLYTNSLGYFTALESDAGRSDTYEGTETIMQPCDIGEFVFDRRMPSIESLRFNGPPDGVANVAEQDICVQHLLHVRCDTSVCRLSLPEGPANGRATTSF